VKYKVFYAVNRKKSRFQEKSSSESLDRTNDPSINNNIKIGYKKEKVGGKLDREIVSQKNVF